MEILLPPFFDNQPNRTIKFDTSTFEVTMALDNLPYIPHNLRLISHDSYITLQNTSIQSMEIITSGISQMIGDVKELNNTFIVKSYDGYIGINVAVGKNNSQPYIDLESKSSSMSLNLNDTFAGEYEIFSYSGRVSARNADNNLDSTYSGNILNGTKKSTNSSIPSNGMIIAKSNSGNVYVDFLNPTYTK
ncbi:15695_t:CDS:2, partial [Racocetra fulgida]